MTIIIVIIIAIIIAIIIIINMKTFLINCSSSRSSVAIGSVSPSGRVLINNWRGIPQVTPVAIIVIMITIISGLISFSIPWVAAAASDGHDVDWTNLIQ